MKLFRKATTERRHCSGCLKVVPMRISETGSWELWSCTSCGHTQQFKVK